MRMWVLLLKTGLAWDGVDGLTKESLRALWPKADMPVEEWEADRCVGPARGRIVATELRADDTELWIEVEWPNGLPRFDWIVVAIRLNPRSPETGAVVSAYRLDAIFLTNEPLFPQVGRIRPEPVPAVQASKSAV